MNTRQKAFFIALVVVSASACVIEKEGWDAIEREDVGHLGPARVFEQKPVRKLRPQGVRCTPKTQKLSSGGCEKALLCVPHGTNGREGICLHECGENRGGILKKNAVRCPPNLRCLRKKDSGFLTIGMFCMEQQSERNKACVAPLDEDACAKGLSCLQISSGHNQCKEECMPEKSCSNTKEPCLIPPYARLELQYDKSNKRVRCNADSCKKNSSACACETARGFFCRRELSGPEGRCVRKIGVCGQI